MNANELRVGNWVEQNSIQYRCIPDTIVMLHNKELELKPIPLTEEWLLRFGMDEALNGWWCKDEVFSYREGYAGLGTNRWTQIQHVHQLQNLYFALTGQELTIKEASK